MRRAGVGLVAMLFAAGACRVPEPGVDAAEDRLHWGDLLGALVELDQVPPSDPGYAQARMLANAVERRMRTSQGLFARGLEMRAQWRDEDALELFGRARRIWPRVPGVDGILTATRHRMRALEVPVAATPLLGGAVRTTRPVSDEIRSETASDAEPGGGEVDPRSIPAAPGGGAAPPADPESDYLPETPLEIRLGHAVAAMETGELEHALDVLEALHAEVPAHVAVRRLLARALHHRALLHYGQGQLELALVQWARVLEIDPAHRQAAAFQIAARTELETGRGY